MKRTEIYAGTYEFKDVDGGVITAVQTEMADGTYMPETTIRLEKNGEEVPGCFYGWGDEAFYMLMSYAREHGWKRV